VTEDAAFELSDTSSTGVELATLFVLQEESRVDKSIKTSKRIMKNFFIISSYSTSTKKQYPMVLMEKSV
jgi:hypothetical protein